MAKSVYMPYIEACPKCGATEDQCSTYNAVDSIGGDTPATSGEVWHCHNCDKWTRFRFVTVLKKMASEFKYPLQIESRGMTFTPIRVFRNGRDDRSHIIHDLHNYGYDTRLVATKKDKNLIVVYGAYIGTKKLAGMIPRIGNLVNAKNVYGTRVTPAAERAGRRWAHKK